MKRRRPKLVKVAHWLKPVQGMPPTLALRISSSAFSTDLRAMRSRSPQHRRLASRLRPSNALNKKKLKSKIASKNLTGLLLSVRLKRKELKRKD